MSMLKEWLSTYKKVIGCIVAGIGLVALMGTVMTIGEEEGKKADGKSTHAIVRNIEKVDSEERSSLIKETEKDKKTEKKDVKSDSKGSNSKDTKGSEKTKKFKTAKTGESKVDSKSASSADKDIKKEHVQEEKKGTSSNADNRPSNNTTSSSTSSGGSEGESNGGSSGNSASNSSSSGNKDSSASTGESQHTHTWVEKTRVIHHEATGHNEQVLVSEAWDEVVTEDVYDPWECCNVCGADVTADPSGHMEAHALAYEGGGNHTEIYKTVQTTVHHDAVYQNQWIQDSVAYDERVSDGFVCSTCGEIK